MNFFDFGILIKQILPPQWRVTGRIAYVKLILAPLILTKGLFDIFRKEIKNEINLSSQILTIESEIQRITEVEFGVFISEGSRNMTIHIPTGNNNKNKEKKTKINNFIKKILPIGRKYILEFY